MGYKVRTNTGKTVTFPTAVLYDTYNGGLVVKNGNGELLAMFAPGSWLRLTPVASVSQE